ncbi:hypothetical protein [Acidovorax radicis]|uniref:hypothetical protein n=1 Tax=Acidovorax radicis TaxID=758826 RepID=UPI00023777DD|nr:hypothetical protein [Acidovorax radicis]
MKYESKFCTTFTLAVLTMVSALAAQGYSTKHALVEINDPKAASNPVKSVSAANWRAVDVKSKLKPKPGQDIAIVCEGSFPAGYIATDLLRPNGEFNRDFSVHAQTTVMDLCNQQEDRMRRVNPKLFK